MIQPLRNSVAFVFLLLSLCGSTSLLAQSKSAKRGVAYGNHQPADLAVLSKGVSWWYNWYHQPEQAVASVYSNYSLDYVPMAWNGSFNKEAMRAFLSTHPDVKYLLGWNEPNFTTQANMTPSEAAAQWHHLEELADEFNLKLVSPAVNYCDQCVSEDGMTYTDPVKYLDAFFEACEGCRVDYIAIHSYMGNASALQWFVGLFKKYNKPIWLTEFANWENNPTLQDQKSFMVGAVDYLENDEDVFRYAWFTGRHSGAPFIGLLNTSQSGVLTELGEIYVNMPLHSDDNYVSLPAKIEAEQYNKMNGILLELTSDETGFANVGYIDAGDWLEYGIDAPETKIYNFSLRVAANQNGILKILVDEELKLTIPITSTGGWQQWITIKEELELTQGKHKVKLDFASGGYNLNWFSITVETVLDQEEPLADLKLYPNPTNNRISIETSSTIDEVKLLNMAGQNIPITLSENRESIPLPNLPSGIYLLTLRSGAKITIQKIVIE